MQKIIFTLVLLSFFIASCKKEGKGEGESNPPLSGNVLSPNAKLIDTTLIVSVSDNIVVIKSANDIKPKVGDILLAAPSLNNPNGLLRKIVSVTEVSGKVTYGTELAGLNEAFRQLDINTTYVEDFTSNSTLNKGVSLGFTISENSVLFPGIKLKGTIKINIPEVKIEYIKRDGETKPSKVLLQAEINTDGSELEITNTSNEKRVLDEKVIKTISLPTIRIIIPIPTPLGVFPLPVPLTQKVIFKMLPLTITNKSSFKITPKVNAVFGVKYEKGNWQNISTLKSQVVSDSLFRDNFNTMGSMTASVNVFNPVYEIAPFNDSLLKASVEIPNEVSFELQPLQTPQYKLKFSNSLTGKISSMLWLGEDDGLSISIPFLDITIKQGSWLLPHTLTYISGNNQEGTSNSYLNNELKVQVKDINGNVYRGAKVDWLIKSGGGKLDTLASLTDDNGYATNKWQLGATDPFEVQAFIKKPDGSHINGSPVTFTATANNYELQIGNNNPDYTKIGAIATLKSGASFTTPNYVGRMVRLTLNGVPVKVGGFGLDWTPYTFGTVPTSASDVTNTAYPVTIYDYTNKRNVTVILNITLKNTAYATIIGKPITIVCYENNVKVATNTFIYSANGTFTRTGPFNSSTGSYSFANVTSPSFDTCPTYIIKDDLAGAVSAAAGDRYVPSYIIINSNGTMRANSFYGCTDMFQRWEIY